MSAEFLRSEKLFRIRYLINPTIDYYEGQGRLRNPNIIDQPYISMTILNSIMFELSILIDLDSQQVLLFYGTYHLAERI